MELVRMLKYMEYAYAVYQAGSFTRAAERLYISQPSLSQIIKKLETEIGQPIFERSGKNITLTPVGEVYIRAVEQILQIRTDLQQQIDDIQSLKTGKLTIGSTTFIASYVLPAIIKEFQNKYPDIQIDLFVEQSTVLEEKLEQGRVDFIIDNAPLQKEVYVYIPWLTEQILLGVPQELPVNEKLEKYRVSAENICRGKKSLRLPITAVRDEKFILLKHGNTMRQTASRIFQEAGIHPEISMEFDLLMSTICYAESGFGICFLTDTILRYGKGCRNLVFYLPDTQYNSRELFVIYKKAKYLTSAAREFISCVTSATANQNSR